MESYKIVFDLFDKDHSGFIDKQDLQEIALSLNRDPQEVISLVQEFDPNSDGRLSFAEFLQDKQKEEQSMNEIEKMKKEFGNMLPRRGVYFLPDYKVLDFLRAQQEELEKIEETQKEQFMEFSKAWDKYMAEYEEAAYSSLEKLKEKHDLEIVQLKEQIQNKYNIKYTFSKELMDIRTLERKLFSLKQYEKAEALKRQAEKMEQEEKQKIEQEVQEKIEQEEFKLRNKQQSQLNSLLKRIQRDRDEQLKHRMADSQRMIQRNKNLLADIVKKQQLEQKKTMDFLKYSLGKRSPKKAYRNYRSAQSENNNENKLPLIRQVKQQQQDTNKSAIQNYDSPNPDNRDCSSSLFMTENKGEFGKVRGSNDIIPKNMPKFISNRSKSTSKNISQLNPFNSNNKLFNAIRKSGDEQHEVQCTETMAKNFKKFQKMQSMQRRYHASSKSMGPNRPTMKPIQNPSQLDDQSDMKIQISNIDSVDVKQQA